MSLGFFVTTCLIIWKTTPTEQDRGIGSTEVRLDGSVGQKFTGGNCQTPSCFSFLYLFLRISKSARPLVAVEVNRSVDLAAIHLLTDYQKAMLQISMNQK